MKSNLINRQDAIDIVSFECGKWKGLSREIAKQINALPSAQPEIIRCKDCKYAEIADPEDNQDGYTCQFHRGSIWFSGSYCSWGERKSDEQV